MAGFTTATMIPCRFLILFGLVAGCLCAKAEGELGILTVFQKRCVQCHGENGKEKGNVNLLKIENAAALASQPELLGSLIDVIDFEEMPPEDEPQIGRGAGCFGERTEGTA